MKINPVLVSKLGSPDSRIPLAVKDIFNSAGYTYFSYDAGGSIEAKDRLLDEAGTGAIWLFGIPVYNKLIDKTLYKAAGISSEVDVRAAKDSFFIKQAVKHAPSEGIKKELLTASSQLGKTKALAIAKFGLSMGLTMLSYFGLTKFKQNMTKLNIEKEFSRKMKSEETAFKSRYKGAEHKAAASSKIFSSFNSFNVNKKNKNNPSFGSAAAAVEDFMLNPVKNMIGLDIGISSQRIISARTNCERREYALKEGGFLVFVYGADRVIKSGLEKASKKFLKKPISLDAKFLSSDMAEKLLKDKTMQKEVDDFGAAFLKTKDTNKLYEFILNNQNNTVVSAAEKSGIIETVKDKSGALKIDTRKYIDPDKIKKLAADLQDFIKEGSSSDNIKKYLNSVRSLKIVSTAASIGACCLSLGYIIPKYMYKLREKQQNGNSGFHVREEYEKELKAKALKNRIIPLDRIK